MATPGEERNLYSEGTTDGGGNGTDTEGTPVPGGATRGFDEPSAKPYGDTPAAGGGQREPHQYTTDEARGSSGPSNAVTVALGLGLVLALVVIVALAIALAAYSNDADVVYRTSSARTPGHWYQIDAAGARPPPRLATAAAVVNDRDMYIFGGMYGFSNVSYGDLWKYDVVENRWTEIATTGDAPSARLHHTLVNANNRRLLLFGGFNYFQTVPAHSSFDDLYSLDLATLRWTRLTPVGPRPSSRGAHEAVFLNGYMYLFGGFNTIGATGHSEELWRYDVAANVWVDVSPATGPQGRIGFAMTELDGELFLFGGGCENGGQCAETWKYSPAGPGSWNNLTATALADGGVEPMERRATNGEVGVHGILYLFGGVHIVVVGGSPQVTMLDDFWSYEPSAGKWMRLHPNFDRGARPPRTFGHTAVRVGDSVVVFGGRVGAPTSPGSNQLWEYAVIPPA